MTPTVTIGNLTVSGDAVIGPGAINLLAKALPRACVGDAVAGLVCVSGAITMPIPTAVNNIMKGRPQANIGSIVAGVSPAGAPLSTTVAVSPNLNLLV